MRKEIRAFINQTTPLIPRDDEDRGNPMTLGCPARAATCRLPCPVVRATPKVSGANVLVAIFSEQESQAAPTS